MRPARRGPWGVHAIAFAACLGGCRDKVSLGAWEEDAPLSTGGSGGGFGDDAGTGQAGVQTNSGGSGLPSCLEQGTPGPLNTAGQLFGITETATDWLWPAPVPSMQWELMVEREIERDSATGPPRGGYYWAHQFSFVDDTDGWLGIQAEGGYQEEPPASPIEFTKIAVFWISGPPLAAELGDIAYPDARVAPDTAGGSSYLTIHARFDWQVCRIYSFRVAPHSTEEDGSTWYGAWITDTAAGVETLLGRMLLPADTGPLASSSVFRTVPIVFGEPTSCDIPAHASAVFGRPRTGDANAEAPVGTNRFSEPPRCSSSRFTKFDSAVRHELGVPP